jgi:hypothetical protein
VIVFSKWIGDSLSGGWASVQRAVLSRPDDYLWVINLGINIVVSAAVFLTGWRLYAASGSLPAALVLQFSLLLFHQTLLGLPRVSPEPFLIAIVFALMIPLIPPLLGEERDPLRASTAAGAVFGFGMITKVTFLPLAAVAILTGGRAERKRFVIASLATGFLFALPIVPRVLKVLHWLALLLIHSEKYGRGPVGLPAPAEWASHLKLLLHAEPFLFCVLPYYALILVAMNFATRDPFTLSVRRLAWVVSVVVLLQLAMTLKHYSARYMLPALVICALLNAFLVLWLSSRALPVLWRRSLALAGAILMAGGAWSSGFAVEGWFKEAARNQTDVRTLAGVRDASGCVTIGYYSASTPGYALAFGSEYTVGVHGKILDELYPDFIFYDQYGGGFRTWSLAQRIVEVRRMVADGRCVLLQGAPSNKIPIRVEPDFSMELIAEAGNQAIYRLLPGPGAIQ